MKGLRGRSDQKMCAWDRRSWVNQGPWDFWVLVVKASKDCRPTTLIVSSLSRTKLLFRKKYYSLSPKRNHHRKPLSRNHRRQKKSAEPHTLHGRGRVGKSVPWEHLLHPGRKHRTLKISVYRIPEFPKCFDKFAKKIKKISERFAFLKEQYTQKKTPAMQGN